ncbi:MAG: sigma-70 family RNA polymerase sigma factor [Verrucomicrobia bacterium]|nr:sigma-70 family RNA polymerase sigma factor [Verrucomicrobiota bacterium]
MPPPGSVTSPSNPVFATTRWTQVLAARGDSVAARQALSDLCAAYYEPVVTYLRHHQRSEDDAREFAHRFFELVLHRRAFDAATPGQGRFRSYLLGAVKHFLAESQRHARAAKRGGGQAPLSLDANAGTDTSSEPQVPDRAADTPDTLFDRHWAATLVDRAAASLASEYADRGQIAQFNTLKPWLLGEIPALSRADAAVPLGLTEGALKVAIHRLRRRFRELVKAEIAQTVSDPAAVREELRYLIEVLTARSDLASSPDR